MKKSHVNYPILQIVYNLLLMMTIKLNFPKQMSFSVFENCAKYGCCWSNAEKNPFMNSVYAKMNI